MIFERFWTFSDAFRMLFRRFSDALGELKNAQNIFAIIDNVAFSYRPRQRHRGGAAAARRRRAPATVALFRRRGGGGDGGAARGRG